MAHLSERHELAKHRREEQLRDRAISLVLRTGYPPEFHGAQTSRQPLSNQALQSSETGNASTADNAGSATITTAITLTEWGGQVNRHGPEQVAATRLRCQQRVQSAHEQEVMTRRMTLLRESESKTESEQRALEAAALARKRLLARKREARLHREAELDVLISQQDSSLEAMNMARMLSPRFQEKVALVPRVAKHSTEDDRVQHLLTSARVGTFYK